MVVMAGMIRPRVTRNNAGPRQMTTAMGFCSRPVALPATRKTIARIAMKPPTASMTPSNVVAAWPAVLESIGRYAVATTGSLSGLTQNRTCLLYTSDAADDLLCVDLGGRRIIKKK